MKERMQTIRHGGLTLDLPGDWEDRSSLLFVAPAGPDLPTIGRVDSSREAVNVEFAFDDRSPQAILQARAEGLEEIDPAFEVIRSAPFFCELGDGWCFEQRLTLGDVAVRQLAVVVSVGPIAILATAAAGEAQFSFVRPKLEAVLRSMRARR